MQQAGNAMEHYAVRAGLAVLEQQYKIAEAIYLEQVCLCFLAYYYVHYAPW
jgi:hypothetical protein